MTSNAKETPIRQEQAFGIAEKLLMHIYSEDVLICAKICTASADKDKEYMASCLDEVIKFCNRLKQAILEE